MWATSAVWQNWRAMLGARGWQTIAPSLRHHDEPPLPPAAALGTVGLDDYASDLEAAIRSLPEKPVLIGHSMGGLIALKLAARKLARACVLLTPAPPSSVFAARPSNLLAFARIQSRWGWWRTPHRATLPEALRDTFNTTDTAVATALHGAFVHDSGRALFEIALPWLDRGRAATVDPAAIDAPLLFVAAGRDRLTPPDVVQRTARRFASDCRLYPGQGHWVLGQPGWQDIARDAADWLEART
ncbi:MAG: alpha/beta fold hydrolase [Enhydrobacter sp.]|nr:alpha/beta fold hydrolase [Enhydrobacter sp.]